MLYSVIVVTWLSSEIFLNRLFRSGPEEKMKADKQSLLTIWVTIMATLPLGSYIAEHTWFPICLLSHFTDIGLVMIVAGMLFRFTAIYTLGRYFTVDVTIRSDHHIIKRGLYKYLRHPSYLGSLVSFIGNGIAMNNWAAFAVAVLPVTLAFLYRIQVEEQLLTANFGQEYTDYKKETWRLLPFIY